VSLKVPRPADAGYTEHLSGKLLAIESETFSGNGVPCSVFLVLRRGYRPTVNLDMEAMAVEALIRAVDGKMGNGTGFAKGIEIKVGFFAVIRQMLPSAGDSPAVRATMICFVPTLRV
jgi:hypothetical protein